MFNNSFFVKSNFLVAPDPIFLTPFALKMLRIYRQEGFWWGYFIK
jgi:hypothetical protein